MKKLTPEEKKTITRKLKEEYNSDEVNYIGCNRFEVRVKYQVDLEDSNNTWLYKAKLFDEKGNPISLAYEYSGIFNFSRGVAVVCTRENIIKGERVTQHQQNGLIDINGKELLPCIYDWIHPHSEGSIEITKDGQKKITFVDEIINGEFEWEAKK